MARIAFPLPLLTCFAVGSLGRGLHNQLQPQRLGVQGPKLTNELLDRFIVIPEHNLLFCYMEKNACTNFNDLFRFLRVRYDPEQASGVRWFRNTPEVHGYTQEMLESILLNKTWHKAVFYRDPIERFAAAYESKCTGVDKTIVQDHCKIQFGKTEMPFADVVKQVRDFDTEGIQDDSGFDPHWKRQVDFCGGLSSTLSYYDTIEELDRKTAHQKVVKVLEAVGVDPRSVPHFEELFPPPEDDSWREEKHNTGTSDELTRYFPPDKPWLKTVIQKHYSQDYDAFGASSFDTAKHVSNLRSVGVRPLLDPV